MSSRFFAVFIVRSRIVCFCRQIFLQSMPLRSVQRRRRLFYMQGLRNGNFQWGGVFFMFLLWCCWNLQRSWVYCLYVLPTRFRSLNRQVLMHCLPCWILRRRRIFIMRKVSHQHVQSSPWVELLSHLPCRDFIQRFGSLRLPTLR
jgi:hypothetical protein